jgi:Outer membrane protein beta-barrel domain
MNKFFLPFLLFILVLHTSFGQLGFGLKGGFSGSTTSQELVNGMSRVAGSAPTFGAVITYDLDLHFAGLLEFNYTTLSEGLKYDSSFFPRGVVSANRFAETTPTINYLQIPIMGRVTFGEKKLKTFLTFGPYLGIGLSGKWKNGPVAGPGGRYITFEGDQTAAFKTGDFKKIDLGGIVGFGGQYAIGKSGTLFAEARLQLGFLDFYNNLTEEQRLGFTAQDARYLPPSSSWRSANITLGYFHTIKLPKKKSSANVKKAGKQKRR